jgi:hypothetical protein
MKYTLSSILLLITLNTLAQTDKKLTAQLQSLTKKL